MIMTELDLIFARGRLSLDYRMSAPQFNQEARLVLPPPDTPCSRRSSEARHLWPGPPRSQPRRPALRLSPPTRRLSRRKLGPGQPVLPVETAAWKSRPPPQSEPSFRSTSISEFAFEILVVTGPNTGGKTVALKTVGLLAIMAQSGLHVPAGEGSQFPIYDDVLADIGDEQSLEQSLSTFSSHVRRISEILVKATSRSLVMLDELGAGTDPTDGAALGRAILDELSRIGCGAIVTTHIGDLKTYAFTNEGAENAAVEFDDETLEPKYRLHVGDIGQSKALKIARQLRLPEHVVERAEAYLAERRSLGMPDWDLLEKLRKETELARQRR